VDLLVSFFDQFKSPTMATMNSLAAIAIAILVAFSVVTVPATAKLEARETPTLTKSDRLEVHRDIPNCSKQVWPSFDRSCLRNGNALKWRVIPLVVSERN
jgi:hypothetical protein